MSSTAVPLLAVHISADVLQPLWCAGGYVYLAASLALAAWRTGEREVARVGVLTAVFFVASQVHVPLGVTTVHLLLNGLVGVILRRRAPLAVGVGLVLQMLLFGHGGWTTLGVNAFILGVPALLVGYAFPSLRRSAVVRNRTIRSVSVFGLSAAWVALAVTAVQFLVAKVGKWDTDPTALAEWWVFRVWGFAPILAVSGVVTWIERRSAAPPDFVLGAAVGGGTTVLTVLLQAAVLWLGRRDDGVQAVAALSVVAHIPVVVIEAVFVGFAVKVLAKAKPDWLGVEGQSAGNISSNGTSH